jgi:hypothetical protein
VALPASFFERIMASEIKSSSSSTGSLEKGRIERVNDVDPKVQPQVFNPHIDTSGINEKKLLRKLDLWLVPWLSFLYLLSFLDRTSIGNAKVCLAFALCYGTNGADMLRQLYHLEKDLGIDDSQYNIALTIFFFSYAIFEVPSNVFLKRLRPSIWLSLLMLLWGVMMVCSVFVYPSALLHR